MRMAQGKRRSSGTSSSSRTSSSSTTGSTTGRVGAGRNGSGSADTVVLNEPAGKAAPDSPAKPRRLSRVAYEAELLRLQGELVQVQEWVKATRQRVVVIFEGRDAAGKGSTIKRVTEYLNPRVARIVALPMPTERQRTQWYFQRYIEQLPAAGEIVLFDRSWYNRAGVERVMGFCTPEEYRRFMHQCPAFERMLAEDGFLLRKYWFSVSDDEQERRFQSRVQDPLRRWKFSPNDLLTRDRWVDFSKAKDEMFVHSDIPEAPWYVIEADIKRHARLNMIAHLLSTLPFERVQPPPMQLTPRPPAEDYVRPPRELFRQVPDHAGELLESMSEGKSSGKSQGSRGGKKGQKKGSG
jgi:polyphosphate kinase 2